MFSTRRDVRHKEAEDRRQERGDRGGDLKWKSAPLLALDLGAAMSSLSCHWLWP